MGMILAILLVIVVAFALMAWLVYISAMCFTMTFGCFVVGFMIGNAVFDNARPAL